MKRLQIISFLFLSFIAFGLQSCGDKSEDEPTVNDIKGTWLLTHYSYKYHYFENGVWWDDSKNEEVTETYIDWSMSPSSYPSKWWDHITFEDKMITVALVDYNLPTRPLVDEYDQDSTEGQSEYLNDLENWYNAVGCINEGWPEMLCPYTLKGNKLYIGSVYNGDILFTSSDSFTLTYDKTDFPYIGEYKRYIYTFKRNS